MEHKLIPSESLEVFTTQNVKEGSRWYDCIFVSSVVASLLFPPFWGKHHIIKVCFNIMITLL